MLEEKLKEVIVAELKRQAANDPRSLSIESSDGLGVEGRIDLGDLAMVIAGAALEEGRNGPCVEPAKLDQEQRLPPDVLPKMVGRGHDGTAASVDREFD